jgi:hypothetical protein
VLATAHTKGGKEPGGKEKDRQAERERAAAAAVKQQLGIKCAHAPMLLSPRTVLHHNIHQPSS